MKRVLLAFDGEHFSRSVFDCAVQMNAVQPIHAVGCFLPAIDYAELLYSFGGVPSGPMYVTDAEIGNETLVRKNISDFKAMCKQYNIAYSILSEETKHIVSIIKAETRFADLLIINGTSFYENIDIDSEAQDKYLTSVIHRSECPVLIVPDNYSIPKSIVLAYDGGEQSAFAIKQFFNLFPSKSDITVLLVHFGHKNEEIPDRDRIELLLCCYHENYEITRLDFHRKREIEQWLASNSNPVIVTGAYGRTGLSELIRKSFASAITKDRKLMVFVAHK